MVRVEGSRVTVGPKFETLDPVEQETTLSLLAGRVFDVPDGGPVRHPLLGGRECAGRGRASPGGRGARRRRAGRVR
jgi:hypothetical protein